MKNLLFILLSISFLGCKSDNNGLKSKSDQFQGDPYTGRVKVSMETPDGEVKTQSGTGSLHFVDSGAISRLVLSGVLNANDGEAGDAGFVLDGSIKNSTWFFQKYNMRFEIDQNGEVTGTNNSPAEKYTFNGTLANTRFDMEVVVEMLEETAGGYPAGSVFTFTYNLSRRDPNSESGSGCKKVRWVLRNVWNPGGGAMNLVRVPICDD